jgi:hypothetical protein
MVGTTRDDQFFALPEETIQIDFGVCVDYEGDPGMFYQSGVIGSGRTVGVYGQQGFGKGLRIGLQGGVVGWSEQHPGVLGWSRTNNGVDAESVSGPGLSAVSFWGPAVSAVSGSVGVRALGQGVGVSGFGSDDSGVVGISGTVGPTVPNPNLPMPIHSGVNGTSDQQPGVIGTSNAQAGVYGFSSSGVGVVGHSTGPFAGFFIGNLLVYGGTKSAAVPFPDGTHRTLFCMESPDNWFEDFGAAKLKGGHVVVRLDADFAKVIKPPYKVFLTPEGECRGLSVRRKTGAGFEVRELMGGKSNVAFSYRIVGQRKDIKGHRRFAKVDLRMSGPTPKAKSARPAGKKISQMPAELRALADRMEKTARASVPSGGRKR